MKNSRKIKRFLVSVLTVTLSIIMFVTQTSAANVVTYNAEFAERAEIVQAYEYITWDSRRNRFTVATDLECYECDDVEYVYAELVLDVYYPSDFITEIDEDDDHDYESDGIYTYLNTEDSDELIFTIANFDCGYDEIEVVAEITYMIAYYNGVYELYQYRHTATVAGDDLSHERLLLLYVYNDDNRID